MSLGIGGSKRPTFQSPASRNAAGTEDSLGKPVGGLSVAQPGYDEEQYRQESDGDPVFENIDIDVRKLDDDAKLLVKHSIAELPISVFANAFDSGYLLSDILQVLRDERIVFQWWILCIPQLAELQSILEKRIPHALLKEGETVASELTKTVYRMLLNTKSLLKNGIIGMIDPKTIAYELPNARSDLVIEKLKGLGIVSEKMEILEIPSRQIFDALFGRSSGISVRDYLWSRKGHVVVTELKESRSWLSSLNPFRQDDTHL